VTASLLEQLADLPKAEVDAPQSPRRPPVPRYEWYRRNAEAAEQRDKPQPTKTVYAPGSMEWLAEQKKSG
jgi:hypothetical protein